MLRNTKRKDRFVKSGPKGTTYSRCVASGYGGAHWSLDQLDPTHPLKVADRKAATEEVEEALTASLSEDHYEVKGLVAISFGGDDEEVELPVAEEVEEDFTGWGEHPLADLDLPAEGSEIATIRPSCLLVADQEVADEAERLEGASYAKAYGAYTPTSDDLAVVGGSVEYDGDDDE